MIIRIDHVGLVARSYEEADDLLLGTLGLSLDDDRNPGRDSVYMARENADIYFLKVGEGGTRIELLLPRDSSAGMGRWLEKRGPSVHHLAYLVDDVAEHAAGLRDKGLRQIDLGPDAAAAFFVPKDTMGILTELVDARTMERLHESTSEGPRRALEDSRAAD